MKSFRFFALAGAVLLAAAPAALGADFGVRAGRFNDIEDEFVGADIEIALGQNLSLIPNIEYILNSDVDSGSLNADLIYNFRNASDFTPFLGAGAGIFRVDAGDVTEDTTLVNAIGGIAWDLAFLRPYAQVKYFRAIEDEAEGDDIAFTVGIRF